MSDTSNDALELADLSEEELLATNGGNQKIVNVNVTLGHPIINITICGHAVINAPMAEA
jgi:hypothetical protein